MRLVDAAYSLAELERVKAAVLARRDLLHRRGADLAVMSTMPEGHVFVGVAARQPAARRLLADLGDRVRIGHGELDALRPARA